MNNPVNSDTERISCSYFLFQWESWCQSIQDVQIRVQNTMQYIFQNCNQNAYFLHTLPLALTPEPFIDLDSWMLPNSSLKMSIKLCFTRLITSFASFTVASSLRSTLARAYKTFLKVIYYNNNKSLFIGTKIQTVPNRNRMLGNREN